ncbi:MAG TPA: hypothetical protein VFI71_12750, partial [Pyrinomonadaceae bacterium]|nr:hypothetical protein [Pyrinomonadaceae bacterium]
EAYKGQVSRVIKGTIDVVGVSRGEPIEMYLQAPDKFLTVIQTSSQGTSKRGFDGSTGWSRNTAGLRTLKGPELEQLKSEVDFYNVLKLKSIYTKMTVAGMSKIGFRDVYVIEAQSPGGSLTRIYFDAETSLVVRINAVSTIGNISGPAEIYLDDWREVDGIKSPFSLSYSFPKATVTMTIKEIKTNVQLDPRMFDP